MLGAVAIVKLSDLTLMSNGQLTLMDFVSGLVRRKSLSLAVHTAGLFRRNMGVVIPRTLPLSCFAIPQQIQATSKHLKKMRKTKIALRLTGTTSIVIGPVRSATTKI